MTSVLYAQPVRPPQWTKTWVNEGVRLQMELSSLEDTAGSGFLQSGELVRFDFKLSDEKSGKPLTGASPAAWMDIDDAQEALTEQSCREKIAAFLGGGLMGKADMDLNSYHVVTLNDDGTLTVVDPMFGYGGTKLLALIQLGGKGKDWTQTADKRLFVSVPEISEVVVVNADRWEIEKRIAMPGKPYRLKLQPDGQYLWVVSEGDADVVTALNPKTLEVAARFSAGAGPHDLAVSKDNRWAFVSNHAAATVTVIDIANLKKTGDFPVPSGPGFMDWSDAAAAVFVSHQDAGLVSILDPAQPSAVTTVPTAKGITRIRFAPGGRFAFIVNPSNDYLYILDAATQKVVQQGKMEAVPDFVTFSNELAYIRHRGSESILMVGLRGIGQPGAPLPAADFPGGDNAPGNTSDPSLADGIVQAPGAHAMLVANPQDKAIYFYKEGMAAPMGSFSNYGRSPLAVTVVDRSLKEVAPGHYQTIARLRDHGLYSLVFFLDAPSMGACFGVEVGGAGDRALKRTMALEGPVKVTPLFDQEVFPVGKPVRLDFALHPHEKAEPFTGLQDVALLATTQSGRWHQQIQAPEFSKVPGVYRAELTFPQEGIYYLHIGCNSHGLTFNHPQYLIVKAINAP